MTTRYTAASFFSGIGGLDLAFVASGFDIVFHCEIDDYCRRVLKKHNYYWMNARTRKDITRVKKTEVGNVDVMFGGFPCTDISVAGKQAGVTQGTRSGLWFELLRLISDIRPRIVVLENVANIATTGGAIVTASLANAGYDAQWTLIRASDVGAPHQRERWFCIAYKVGNTRRNRHCNPTASKRLPHYANTPRRASQGVRTNDMAHAQSQRQQKGRTGPNRNHETLPDQLKDRGVIKSQALNPDWEELLMGLPVGWTDVDMSHDLMNLSSHMNHQGLQEDVSIDAAA